MREIMQNRGNLRYAAGLVLALLAWSVWLRRDAPSTAEEAPVIEDAAEDLGFRPMTFRVMDALTGSPLLRAVVAVAGPSGTQWSGRTGPDGRIKGPLGRVGGAIYRLSLRAEGHERETWSVPESLLSWEGESIVRLWPRTTGVEGVIGFDEWGKAARLTWRIEAPRSAGLIRSPERGRAVGGPAHLEGLPPGALLVLEVTGDRGRHRRWTHSVPPRSFRWKLPGWGS